jgi:hypothetical protein
MIRVESRPTRLGDPLPHLEPPGGESVELRWQQSVPSCSVKRLESYFPTEHALTQSMVDRFNVLAVERACVIVP